MTEFFKVINIDEARDFLRKCWPQFETETVTLDGAPGRTLACDIIAAENLPPFPRSTVDGYAVRAGDVFGASESIPAFLTLVGEVQMASQSDYVLQPGECMWIPTGGVLPEKADAAVMVEYSERLGEDTVIITRPVSPGDNVIRVGEDCLLGEAALPKGRVMRPQDLGVAAALGVTHLKVNKPQKIGIISTGDEIVDIEATPKAGQIRDVNSHVLAAAVGRRGGQAHIYGVVPDDFERLKSCIAQALKENDGVILSGGSSVGIRDLSLQVLQSFPDSQLLFHGLSVKPGKPTLGLKIGDQVVIGLPGHPVSALMVFEVLVGPLLGGGRSHLAGATLAANVASQAGRDDFVRVELGEENGVLMARPVYGKAGLIRIMSQAHGFIHIPYEKQGLNKGEPVMVHIF